jgi:hypothetical protein
VAPCADARSATDFLVERDLPPLAMARGDLRSLARRRRRAAMRRHLRTHCAA